MLLAQPRDGLGDESSVPFVDMRFKRFWTSPEVIFLHGASLTKLYDWIVLLVTNDLYQYHIIALLTQFTLSASCGSRCICEAKLSFAEMLDASQGIGHQTCPHW